MATKNVMVDIETLATAGDALVLSIGAQLFSSTDEGPVFGDTLLMVPNLIEQILLGRRIDRDTQMWWAKQDPAAREHWVNPVTNYSVRSALSNLDNFVKDVPRIWSRGPHFDIAILDSLYLAVGMAPGWKYNTIRDVRTFCDDADARIRMAPPIDSGVMGLPAHHPLEDCRVQIVDLWEHGLK